MKNRRYRSPIKLQETLQLKAGERATVHTLRALWNLRLDLELMISDGPWDTWDGALLMKWRDDVQEKIRDAEMDMEAQMGMRDGFPIDPPRHPPREAELSEVYPRLRAEGWKVVTADEASIAYLTRARPSSGLSGTWRLTDNGGEWGVEKVNDEGPTRRDIPTRYNGAPVDAGTMAYRVLAALRGDSIDWDYRDPDLARV